MINRKNKGATLVELIVAMAVLAIIMAQLAQLVYASSRLYLNGTYEVDLQTEAQNIILQVEDMLVDARVSISADYVDSISSDKKIVISTNNIYTDEKIEYSISFDEGHYDELHPELGGKPYGQLYLSVKEGAASATDPLLMADYVKSVSLDFTYYNTANMIKMYVVMQNDKYSYSTSKDIFIRNMLGTGIGKRGNKKSGENMQDLDVLRFGSYNLNNVCFENIEEFKKEHYVPDSITYEWIDSSLTGVGTAPLDWMIHSVSDAYVLTGTTLACGDLLNERFDEKVGGLGSNEFQIACYANKGGAKEQICSIQLGTVPVAVGFGRDFTNTVSPYGFAAIYAQIKYSEDLWNTVPVFGIDITKFDTVDIKTKMVGPASALDSPYDFVDMSDLTPSSFPVTLTASSDFKNRQYASGFTGNSVETLVDATATGDMSFGTWAFDTSHNTFLVKNGSSMGNKTDFYLAFLNAGYCFRTDCIFDFDGEELSFAVYYLMTEENFTDATMDAFITEAKDE